MNDSPTCTATQLIQRLQALVDAHGDGPIYVEDAETGWLLAVGVTGDREGFLLTSSYHQEPDGYIPPVEGPK